MLYATHESQAATSVVKDHATAQTEGQNINVLEANPNCEDLNSINTKQDCNICKETDNALLWHEDDEECYNDE